MNASRSSMIVRSMRHQMVLQGDCPKTLQSYGRAASAFLDWCDRDPEDLGQDDTRELLVHLALDRPAPARRRRLPVPVQVVPTRTGSLFPLAGEADPPPRRPRHAAGRPSASPSSPPDGRRAPLALSRNRPTPISTRRNGLNGYVSPAVDRPEVAARIPIPFVPQQPIVLPRRAQLRGLLACAPSPLYRAAMMLGYGAGLRVSEACSLRREDVLRGERLVRVRDAKGGHGRDVMLGRRIELALDILWSDSDSEWALESPWGGRPVGT